MHFQGVVFQWKKGVCSAQHSKKLYGILTQKSDQKDDQFLLRASLSHHCSYIIFKTRVLAFFFQRAMVSHRSQLVWFRMLYILVSRYMVLNSFRTEKCTVATHMEQ